MTPTDATLTQNHARIVEVVRLYHLSRLVAWIGYVYFASISDSHSRCSVAITGLSQHSHHVHIRDVQAGRYIPRNPRISRRKIWERGIRASAWALVSEERMALGPGMYFPSVLMFASLRQVRFHCCARRLNPSFTSPFIRSLPPLLRSSLEYPKANRPCRIQLSSPRRSWTGLQSAGRGGAKRLYTERTLFDMEVEIYTDRHTLRTVVAAQKGLLPARALYDARSLTRHQAADDIVTDTNTTTNRLVCPQLPFSPPSYSVSRTPSRILSLPRRALACSLPPALDPRFPAC